MGSGESPAKEAYAGGGSSSVAQPWRKAYKAAWVRLVAQRSMNCFSAREFTDSAPSSISPASHAGIPTGSKVADHSNSTWLEARSRIVIVVKKLWKGVSVSRA
ncbi:MAG: hypothetical protein MUO77_00525 [Anaerolineales bacterium]|nr:hypothetical protein [Anaerolineales bacterium]